MRRASAHLPPIDLAAPDESGAPPPFATQFFNDDGPDYDDDMAMGDDVGDIMGTQMPVNEEDDDVDLLATTSGKLKRVRPQFISYAKKAKRVDVRKLKESIWKEIEPEVRPRAPPISHRADAPTGRRRGLADQARLQQRYSRPAACLPEGQDGRALDQLALHLRTSVRRSSPCSALALMTRSLGNEHGLRFQLDRDEATANILDNDAASTSVGRLTSLRITRES